MADIANQKIEAEIAKLKEETEKIKLEREKAAEDFKRYRYLFGFEILKACGSIGTFIVAAAAVFTFGWNVYTHSEESSRKANERISSLLKDLDKPPPVRAAAIVSLSPYINDSTAGPAVLLTLTHMIGGEDDTEVRSAILNVLSLASTKAVPHLKSVRQRLIADIEPMFNDVQRIDDRIGPSSAPSPSDVELRHSFMQQIKRRQKGLVAIAVALRDLSCPQKPSVKCPADFSKHPFKDLEFVGTHGILAGGNFKEAVLWAADLFGIDLAEADFTDAWINEADLRQTTLSNARFINSHIELVERKGKANYLARFEMADLKDAQFSGSCLSGADFRGARNLDVGQFKDAFVNGALFDQDFQKKLELAGYIRANVKCKVWQR